jgi:hypothetical protein
MSSRVFRPIAATLSALILAQATARAEPVTIRQVIDVVGKYQNTSDLRLRSLTTSATPVSIRSTRVSSRIDKTEADNSLLSGVVIDASDPKVGVSIDNSGDFEGTICDCGEIEIAAGGFPKWPLIFLAAVPLFFIHDCDDCDYVGPTPIPLPTPPPSPVPEPASMLLFGSGLIALAAGLRRKYARGKITAEFGEES